MPRSYSGTHRKRHKATTLTAITLCLAEHGCAGEGAPSFSFFGAYFPLWMFCAIVGIVAAIIARFVFVATGLSGVIPFQLFVCTAIGLLIGLAAWLLWLGPIT